MLHVFRVELHAAVAAEASDAPRKVRAVEAVERAIELDPVFAERVVRIAALDEAPPVTALAQVLQADLLGNPPGGFTVFPRTWKTPCGVGNSGRPRPSGNVWTIVVPGFFPGL
jgi:hypothetical protein